MMKRLFPAYFIKLIGFILFAGALLAPALQLHAQEVSDTTTIITEEVETDDPQPPAETIDSDDEEGVKKTGPYFDEKTDTDSFTVRERRLPDGYPEKLKKDKDFWYADKSFNKVKETKKENDDEAEEYVPLGKRSWVQTLLWVLMIVGFATAIAFYLADSNIGLFRRKNKPAGPDELHDEEMPEDIFAINYQKEIDKAVGQQNYRLAVRLHFLRLLRLLSEKNIIQYKQDKTNLDYLMDLHPTKHYQSFFRLTRHFEYAWYGQFEVGKDAYEVIANEFNQFGRDFNY